MKLTTSLDSSKLINTTNNPPTNSFKPKSTVECVCVLCGKFVSDLEDKSKTGGEVLDKRSAVGSEAIKKLYLDIEENKKTNDIISGTSVKENLGDSNPQARLSNEDKRAIDSLFKHSVDPEVNKKINDLNDLAIDLFGQLPNTSADQDLDKKRMRVDELISGAIKKQKL